MLHCVQAPIQMSKNMQTCINSHLKICIGSIFYHVLNQNAQTKILSATVLSPGRKRAPRRKPICIPTFPPLLRGLILPREPGGKVGGAGTGSGTGTGTGSTTVVPVSPVPGSDATGLGVTGVATSGVTGVATSGVTGGKVGESVTGRVGDKVSPGFVGPSVGFRVGASVGALVGDLVGASVGDLVGFFVGLKVSPSFVGPSVGFIVGASVGPAVGGAVGVTVKTPTIGTASVGGELLG
mmetsp:Transcript_1685/g.3530  ORF Transcript_1685/g.3530 Transcript_1685/m.3530 type:complete len:238 (-) Transcript_1685:139-852(-)